MSDVAKDVDLVCVHFSFEECNKDDFQLEAYNRAFDQLHNLFGVLGTVFGFIASDVREKIDILEKLRNSDENPNGEHYVNTEKMMLYEIQVNKDTGNELFGSRTLLRLHRALKFTILFLERFCELDSNGNVAAVATSSYKESLSNFHPWLIRNAAKLAMYTLPSRKEFILKINNGVVPDESEIKEKLTNAVESMKPVYEGIENLYTKYDLHALP